MMIRVMYHDGRYDMVKRWALDMLIDQKKIQGFLRSSGWVRIGIDQIRSSRKLDYQGPERRVPIEYPPPPNIQ